jgi:hypothetical protein
MLDRVSYPGGKSGAGVYQTIINLMPPHRVYIEPFLGGGAIMRLKRPAALNIGIDLDPNVISKWEYFNAETGDGTRSPESSPVPAISAATAENGDAAEPRAGGAGSGICHRRGQRWSTAAAVLAASADARSLIAGSDGGIRYRRNQRGMPAALAGSGDADRPEYRLLVGDGIAFLRSYRFTGAELVYCDPPYVHATRSRKDLYRCEMTDSQHRALLRLIKRLPCKVMLSGYQSRLYADELEGWNLTTFQAMTRAGRPATEHLWLNFPPPVALHDYRFLGADFRERERIKRKEQRWVNRLRRMPTLERQALLSALATTGIPSESSSFQAEGLAMGRIAS